MNQKGMKMTNVKNNRPIAVGKNDARQALHSEKLRLAYVIFAHCDWLALMILNLDLQFRHVPYPLVKLYHVTMCHTVEDSNLNP